MYGCVESGTVAGNSSRNSSNREIVKHPTIAYYITSHGYGHGVRSCDVIRAVNRLHPDVSVYIVTKLPSAFLTSHIGSPRNAIRAESFDIGMVQLDSIRTVIGATLSKIEELYSRRDELIAQEIEFLNEQKIDLIVADIPAIPFEAAAIAGIPCVGVGNFGWDWIYSNFVSRDEHWRPVMTAFSEGYSKTDLLLRLPFCEEMTAFPNKEDIPLVASPGTPRRSHLCSLTGADPKKKWILLSFTTLDWSDTALAKVELLKDYEFFTVLPLEWHRGNIHPLQREDAAFSDVVASVDAVLSKPGFGILSDCMANRKPLIYADRQDFLEYPILEAAIKQYLKHVHIPAEDLYAGELQSSLDQIGEAPEALQDMPLGGDAIAANRIVGFLG
jgi:L-arabinokinase